MRLSGLRIVLTVGMFAAAALAWFIVTRTGDGRDPNTASARVGSPAPPLSLQLLDGGSATLAQQRGKVVVVNFWATWCVPCRTEMPRLQELATQMAGQPFAFYAVDLEESPDQITPFRRELGLTVPILLDDNGDATRIYGVRGLPATFVIDKQGILRQQRLGQLVDGDASTPWSSDWLGEQVRTLLSG